MSGTRTDWSGQGLRPMDSRWRSSNRTMPPVEDAYAFACPYCFAEISITVDVTGGRRQTFTADCEVCCRPIAIQLEVGAGGVTSFNAEQES